MRFESNTESGQDLSLQEVVEVLSLQALLCPTDVALFCATTTEPQHNAKIRAEV